MNFDDPMFSKVKSTGPRSTSYSRFYDRIQEFKHQNRYLWEHHFYWFLHNCIAHPLIGICPIKKFFEFHDWTSKKINGR